MDAVANAVQNCIDNLSGTSVNTNAHPGDPYTHQPRTREELLASQQQAANARQVDQRAGFRQLQDPAASALGAESAEQLGIEQFDEEPAPPPTVRRSQPKPKSNGWLM